MDFGSSLFIGGGVARADPRIRRPTRRRSERLPSVLECRQIRGAGEHPIAGLARQFLGDSQVDQAIHRLAGPRRRSSRLPRRRRRVLRGHRPIRRQAHRRGTTAFPRSWRRGRPPAGRDRGPIAAADPATHGAKLEYREALFNETTGNFHCSLPRVAASPVKAPLPCRFSASVLGRLRTKSLLQQRVVPGARLP